MNAPSEETGRHFEDLAAERAVLGAVLSDNEVMSEVSAMVSADDFAAPAHSQIFLAMLALDQKQLRVDPLTLSEQLKEAGQLALVGGPTYLAGLDAQTPYAQNAVDYARIVKDQALRRALQKAGRAILDLASQPTGDVRELVDDAERRVFAVAEKKRTGELVAMRELMEPALTLLEKLQSSKGGITGVPTGFIDLDRLLTGLHGGELIIVAARPGIGKTSLAMNIAMHVATAEQKGVGVFSLEMPSLQLVMRLLATAARVNMTGLRSGRISQHDNEKVQDAASSLFNAPLYIDDSGSLSAFDLRAKARRLKKKDPSLSLIVIDYLQLMHQKGNVESRQLEVAEISRALKSLAKELDLPIIALSQLNRKVEERKGGTPMLSDLRESGAIEQDADVVMFIHKEEDEEGAPPKRGAIPVQLIVAKQRNGATGPIDLVFLEEFTRFESMSRGPGE